MWIVRRFEQCKMDLRKRDGLHNYKYAGKLGHYFPRGHKNRRQQLIGLDKPRTLIFAQKLEAVVCFFMPKYYYALAWRSRPFLIVLM